MAYGFASNNYAAGDYGYQGSNYAAGGIFSSIGRAIGSVARVAGGILPGPLGTAARAVGNVLAPARAPVASPASLVQMTAPPVLQAPGSFTGVRIGGPSGFQVGYQTGQTGSVSVQGVPGMNGGCPSGYHLNKSGYFLKSGQYVPPGTACVKNRRMNPANPKALRRGLRRAAGFGKLARRARRDIARAAHAVGHKHTVRRVARRR